MNDIKTSVGKNNGIAIGSPFFQQGFKGFKIIINFGMNIKLHRPFFYLCKNTKVHRDISARKEFIPIFTFFKPSHLQENELFGYNYWSDFNSFCF